MTLPTIGGLSLPLPFMVGAGACKTPEQTTRWLEVAPVVSGSYTLKARSGNQGDRLTWPDTLDGFLQEGKAFNWLGMPNCGMKPMLHSFEQTTKPNPLIISIAGFGPQEYIDAITQVVQSNVADAIELNFGCQNTEHPPLSFDLPALNQLFECLQPVTVPLWCKFSAYVENRSCLLEEAAHLVNEYREKFAAVVTCNTYWTQAGTARISSPDGNASLSGPELGSIAVEQLGRFREALNPSVDVIAVGGITTGADIIDRLERGAAGVQLTSLPFFMGHNVNAFLPHLLEDGTLEPYLYEKGYIA